jgi:hypothetical protein
MSNLTEKIDELQLQLATQHGQLLERLDNIQAALAAPAQGATLDDLLAVLNDIHADTMSQDQKLLLIRNQLISDLSPDYSLMQQLALIRMHAFRTADNSESIKNATEQTSGHTLEAIPLLEAIRDCSCDDDNEEPPPQPPICSNYTAELPILWFASGQELHQFGYRVDGINFYETFYDYIGVVEGWFQRTTQRILANEEWYSYPYDALQPYGLAEVGIVNTGSAPFMLIVGGRASGAFQQTSILPGQCVQVPNDDDNLFLSIAVNSSEYSQGVNGALRIMAQG